MRTVSRRNFEFLGACEGDRQTPRPGDTSFTTALIWAFQELAKTRSPFTTQELQQKIVTAPKFPESQHPHLCEREEHCVERLVLSAIPKEGENINLDEFAVPNTEALDDYVDLRFCFKERPDSKDIEQLAEELKHLINRQMIKTYNVRWVGLPNLEKAREVVSQWRRSTRKSSKDSSLSLSPSTPNIMIQMSAPNTIDRLSLDVDTSNPWDKAGSGSGVDDMILELEVHNGKTGSVKQDSVPRSRLLTRVAWEKWSLGDIFMFSTLILVFFHILGAWTFGVAVI
jgi:hypothetical protein